ncbi:hypothetical protein AB1Y20_015947 [Prymnesium parvum]|uniref:Uncharacterized protein n=1 Tax=Prymnesium parvum TaxID=97485 RepID=A0AB34K1P0_PRYPA
MATTRCHAFARPDAEWRCAQFLLDLSPPLRSAPLPSPPLPSVHDGCDFVPFLQLDARRLRVGVADYALLRRDFAALRRLTAAQIDRWLVAQARWMRLTQLRDGAARGAMEEAAGATRPPLAAVPARLRDALVPARYGRAAILPAMSPALPETPIGLLDIKGNGAAAPVGVPADGRSHSVHHGLLLLDDAYSEFFSTALMEAALASAAGDETVVGAYAVLAIDGLLAGSNASWPWSRGPAGMIVRQARRRAGGFLTAPHWLAARVERLLHPFGLSLSTRPSPDVLEEEPAFGGVLLSDVQTAANGAIIDLHTMCILNSELAVLPRVPIGAWFRCGMDHNRGHLNHTRACAEGLARSRIFQGEPFTPSDRPALVYVLQMKLSSPASTFKTAGDSAFTRAWASLLPLHFREHVRESPARPDAVMEAKERAAAAALTHADLQQALSTLQNRTDNAWPRKTNCSADPDTRLS